MDTNRIPKQALQYKPKGRRHIGRPRRRWRVQFRFEDQGTGNTPNPSWIWWWWWWRWRWRWRRLFSDLALLISAKRETVSPSSSSTYVHHISEVVFSVTAKVVYSCLWLSWCGNRPQEMKRRCNSFFLFLKRIECRIRTQVLVWHSEKKTNSSRRPIFERRQASAWLKALHHLR